MDAEHIAENFKLFFTREWLKGGSSCPKSADIRLQILMHDSEFYVKPKSAVEIPIELSEKLRMGTSLENLDKDQLAIFHDRVRNRVQYFTEQLVNAPHLILYYHKRNGELKQTDRFVKAWLFKETHWGVDRSDSESYAHKPVSKKKRKGSKGARANLISQYHAPCYQRCEC